MEDERIQDGQITASTSYGSHLAAIYSRLNHTTNQGGWAPSRSDLDQWIQVDFGVPRMVSGIVLQGKNTHNQWVTKYKVDFSDDGISFTYVKDVDNVTEMVRSLLDLLLLSLIIIGALTCRSKGDRLYHKKISVNSMYDCVAFKI